jgi:hypothetical protein
MQTFLFGISLLLICPVHTGSHVASRMEYVMLLFLWIVLLVASVIATVAFALLAALVIYCKAPRFFGEPFLARSTVERVRRHGIPLVLLLAALLLIASLPPQHRGNVDNAPPAVVVASPVA